MNNRIRYSIGSFVVFTQNTCKKELTMGIEKPVTCPSCSGTMDITAKVCPHCGISSFLSVRKGDEKILCDNCYGKGYVYYGFWYPRHTCVCCWGEGKFLPEETYDTRTGEPTSQLFSLTEIYRRAEAQRKQLEQKAVEVDRKENGYFIWSIVGGALIVIFSLLLCWKYLK